MSSTRAQVYQDAQQRGAREVRAYSRHLVLILADGTPETWSARRGGQYVRIRTPRYVRFDLRREAWQGGGA
mgnify:CR=1 FL=1